MKNSDILKQAYIIRILELNKLFRLVARDYCNQMFRRSVQKQFKLLGQEELKNDVDKLDTYLVYMDKREDHYKDKPFIEELEDLSIEELNAFQNMSIDVLNQEGTGDSSVPTVQEIQKQIIKRRLEANEETAGTRVREEDENNSNDDNDQEFNNLNDLENKLNSEIYTDGSDSVYAGMDKDKTGELVDRAGTPGSQKGVYDHIQPDEKSEKIISDYETRKLEIANELEISPVQLEIKANKEFSRTQKEPTLWESFKNVFQGIWDKIGKKSNEIKQEENIRANEEFQGQMVDMNKALDRARDNIILYRLRPELEKRQLELIQIEEKNQIDKQLRDLKSRDELMSDELNNFMNKNFDKSQKLNQEIDRLLEMINKIKKRRNSK